MNIKSDGTTNKFKAIRNLTAIFNLIMFGIILGMSYNYIPENPIYVLLLVAISLVLVNFKYSMAPKKYLQKTEDEPLHQSLSEMPILGTVNFLLALATFGTMVIGNMVGWYWFLIGIIISTVITKIYKDKAGIVKKNML